MTFPTLRKYRAPVTQSATATTALAEMSETGADPRPSVAQRKPSTTPAMGLRPSTHPGTPSFSRRGRSVLAG